MDRDARIEHGRLTGNYPSPRLVWVGDTPEERVLEQAQNAQDHPNVAGVALMADNHLGYAVPIGSVVAYRDAISPSGVGYDIGCGVKAIRTDLVAGDFFYANAADRLYELQNIIEEIQSEVSFGVGRNSGFNTDHPVLDAANWAEVPDAIKALRDAAAQQLGTVGGGNHYVDLLVETEDETGLNSDPWCPIWIACHFGSRGLGHKIATHFLKAGGARDGIMEKPLVFTKDQDPELFYSYLSSMSLAGQYAYAGRDIVLQQVLDILGTKGTYAVHNHHNFAWREEHSGEDLWVVRKGATPAFPGQEGFVGGSMADMCAIVEGQDSGHLDLFNSTVHGAGRIHSRTWAKGKYNRKTGEAKTKGNVTRQMMGEATKDFGVIVRGGDVDESPFVYRKLAPVLKAQGTTIKTTHWLRPVGVVMADARTHDPWKD
jgi:tRNA-splicing ligase RtcB